MDDRTVDMIALCLSLSSPTSSIVNAKMKVKGDECWRQVHLMAITFHSSQRRQRELFSRVLKCEIYFNWCNYSAMGFFFIPVKHSTSHHFSLCAVMNESYKQLSMIKINWRWDTNVTNNNDTWVSMIMN